MELAQDWRLYQKLTRSRKMRTAKLLPRDSEPGDASPVTAVVAGVGDSRVVTVFSRGRRLEDWVGRSLEELRSHLGENQVLCVLTQEDLRQGIAAAGSGGLFEQRRAIRASLEKNAAARKGNGVLSRADDSRRGQSGHFLVEAFGGWWKKVLPARHALWLRFSEEGPAGASTAAARAMPVDQLLFFKDGLLVGCGTPDLTSLGLERIWKPEAVSRHLSEKYLCPIYGLQVSAREWEGWMDAPKPWKAVKDSLQNGTVVFTAESAGLKNLMQARARLGL